jgi:hypothetical protein
MMLLLLLLLLMVGMMVEMVGCCLAAVVAVAAEHLQHGKGAGRRRGVTMLYLFEFIASKKAEENK